MPFNTWNRALPFEHECEDGCDLPLDHMGACLSDGHPLGEAADAHFDTPRERLLSNPPDTRSLFGRHYTDVDAGLAVCVSRNARRALTGATFPASGGVTLYSRDPFAPEN